MALDERNVDALTGLSIAHGLLELNSVTDHRTDHLQAAEEAALRAVTLAPYNAQAHAALGRALIASDRGEEAVGEFEHALALDRNLAHVHGLLGMSKRSSLGPRKPRSMHARHYG